MSDLFEIFDGKPFVSTLTLAAQDGFPEHESILQLIRNHHEDFCEAGNLTIQLRRVIVDGEPQAEKFVLLNHRQTAILFVHIPTTNKILSFEKLIMREFDLFAENQSETKDLYQVPINSPMPEAPPPDPTPPYRLGPPPVSDLPLPPPPEEAGVSVQDLLEIVDGEPRVSTLTLAAQDGLPEHASIIKMVRKHLEDFQRFGPIRFEIQNSSVPNGGIGAGRPTEYARLNERQCTLLFTYMRNSKKVRACKMRLVEEFYRLAESQPEMDVLDQIIESAQRMKRLQAEQKVMRAEQAFLRVEQKEMKLQLSSHERRLDEFDSETGYATVSAYCRKHGIPAPVSFANMVGRRASKICRKLGIRMGDVPDERWSTVHSYPIEVLDEVMAQLRKEGVQVLSSHLN